MGYKILDVKADIHEDVKKYFEKYWYDGRGHDMHLEFVHEDILDIVDKHFEKIER